MNEFIGSKLKTLLESIKMSIEELARKSNVTIEQISEIINNQVTPTLQTTARLAEAMDVRVGTLLDGSEAKPISIMRHNESVECSNSYSTSHAGQNLTYKAATTKSNRNMDPYLISVSDEELGKEAMQSHEGEEFIYVVDGTVEFRYGKNITILEKGDTIYFDSLVPHCMKASSKGGAQILATHYRI